MVCCIEGSRPLLVEVQALVSGSLYGTPVEWRSGSIRTALALLVAVLEKRAGLTLVGEDVFVNVAGGMSIDEPAADLAVAAAVASSVRNRPVRQKTVVFGEIGLAGEVRAVTQAARRVREAAQMGFTRCILPKGNIDPRDLPATDSCELVGVSGRGKRARRALRVAAPGRAHLRPSRAVVHSDVRRGDPR